MKKTFRMMMALAIATFTFTACEDVPEPYNNPYNGQKEKEPEVVIEPTGTGTLDDPYNVTRALEVCAEVGETGTSSEVYTKGLVTSISEISASYGNATFIISDDAKASNKLTIYRAMGLEGKNITDESLVEVGDTVVIYGNLVNYKGNTPEYTQGCYIYSVKKGEGGEKPASPGTADAPLTVAQALEYIDGLGADTQSPTGYVKGKICAISEIDTGQYGNATYLISDDGTENGATLQIYRGYGFGGAKFKSATDIKVSDEVIITGKLINFRGNTKQFAQGSSIYMLNGKTSGGDTPSGEVTKATIAEFNAAAVSNDVWYELTGTVKNLKDGDQYGNFDLEDATGSVYVYGLLSEKGGEKKKFQDLVAAKGIKNGSKLTIHGTRGEFNGKIGVLNAYFVSVDNSGSGVDPTPSGDAKGTGTLADPYNSVAATNLAKSLASGAESSEVYIKGKIVSVKEQYGTQYGNATFYISDDGTESNQFYVFRTLYLENKKYTSGPQIAKGDEVIVCGKITNYQGNTPETVQNASYLYSLNGKTTPEGGSDPTPSGEVKKVSVADFNAAAVSDDVWYELTGTVKNLKDGDEYGNFDLEDATGSVYVYGLLAEKGGEKKKFQDLVAAKGIANGCKLTIHGTRGDFKGKIEVMNAYFVSIEGGSDPNPGGGDDPNPGGGGEVSGNSLTVVFGDLGITGIDSAIKLTDGTTISFAQEDGKNPPIYHESTKIIRMYARNSLTINGSKKIASVILSYDTYSGTAYCGNDELYGEAGGNKITPAKDDKALTFNNVNNSTLKVVNAFAEKNSGGVQLRLTGFTVNYAQ